MSDKKTIIIVTLCVVIAIVSIGYAAFSTSLNVTSNTTGSGGICVAYKCECSTTTGLEGANAPTATCTPTTETNNPATAEMKTQLNQPGDEATCTWTVKNCSAFRIKTSAPLTCTGEVASPFTKANSSIEKDKILDINGTTTFTVTIGYSSSQTTQPSTTDSGIVSCTIPWMQVG